MFVGCSRYSLPLAACKRKTKRALRHTYVLILSIASLVLIIVKDHCYSNLRLIRVNNRHVHLNQIGKSVGESRGRKVPGDVLIGSRVEDQRVVDEATVALAPGRLHVASGWRGDGVLQVCDANEGDGFLVEGLELAVGFEVPAGHVAFSWDRKAAGADDVGGAGELDDQLAGA